MSISLLILFSEKNFQLFQKLLLFSFNCFNFYSKITFFYVIIIILLHNSLYCFIFFFEVFFNFSYNGAFWFPFGDIINFIFLLFAFFIIPQFIPLCIFTVRFTFFVFLGTFYMHDAIFDRILMILIQYH